VYDPRPANCACAANPLRPRIARGALPLLPRSRTPPFEISRGVEIILRIIIPPPSLPLIAACLVAFPPLTDAQDAIIVIIASVVFLASCEVTLVATRDMQGGECHRRREARSTKLKLCFWREKNKVLLNTHT
jgi:hypothetical protein